MALSKLSDFASNSSISDGLSSMVKEFTCAICHELFVRAHTLSCSHTFCEQCIYNWLKKNNMCPLCVKAVIEKPVHSIVLDNAISRLVELLKCLSKEVEAKATASRAVNSMHNTAYHRNYDFGDFCVQYYGNSTMCINFHGYYDDDDTDDDDDPFYNGLPGNYWGGYGYCYKCGKYVLCLEITSNFNFCTGDPSHWANGCPNVW